MATLPPTQAPNATEYAGDEVNALILDPGSHSVRAGFAGEDVPKSVVPTSYGQLPSGERLFGENAIHLPRPDLEIRNPYDAEGIVEDWETASKLWEYTITSRLIGARPTAPSKNGLNDGKDEQGDVDMAAEIEGLEEQEKHLQEFPLLVSEPPWNPKKERERTIELAMEDWGVPAFFLAKTGQLAAYSQSKATALVVDIGARNTSVTAVWDGMVLGKSLHHTPLAGDWLTNQVRLMFAQQQPPVPLIPHYMVKSKTPVDANAPSSATYAKYPKPPTSSFHLQEEDRVLAAFKESVVQAWQGPGRLDSPAGQGNVTNSDYVKSIPPKPFELPDGWNTVFGLERFRVVEGLFDPAAAYTSPSIPKPNSDTSIPSIINKALQAVDVDSRPVLLNNIILTGAGSLIDKLPERIQADVQALYPNPKVRVLAHSSSVERKYGAFIGGSVLGSLGSFHQMWISREEYAESGRGVVEKRYKGHESDGSVELLKPTVYVPPPTKTRRTLTATKTNKPKAEKLTDEQLATLQASLFEQSRQKLNPTQVQPEDVMELSPDNIIKHLESELTKAKSRIAQLEGQEAAAVGHVVQAREEKSKVHQTLTNLRKTLLSRDQSIKRLQEKNAKLEAEVQQQKHVIAMLEAQAEELRRYSHGLRYQHAQASEFHNNMISNLQTEVDGLTAMVEEAKKHV
nr:hypothetical protein B0A51_05314 [Rachicladosporium sp. CCFEE 5018]